MNSQEKIQASQGSVMIPGGRAGVLLIHSLGGNPIELRFLAQGLGRAGYTVHCPVLHGMSGGTDISGMSTWQDWFAAVCAAHDELRKHCDTILVGGLSAGGVLALRLAAMRPDTIQGVILFAPTLWPNGWAIPWYFNFFRLVHDQWFARLFNFQQRPPFGIKDERIRNFVIEQFKGSDRSIEELFGRGGGMVLQFRKMVANVKRMLGEIRQSTMIFHPRFDDQSDLSNAMLLQRKLGGLVETLVLDDCYHMVTLDRQRHLVVERSIDFAGRLSALEADKPVSHIVKGVSLD